jgi:uncharacterized protein (DUF1501 family)
MCQKINKQRRKFIQQIGMLAGGASLLATQTNLQLMKSALAANYSGLSDYKSLVCVFLAGGNDSFNMFVPHESAAHQNYQEIRQEIALPRGGLNPVSGSSSNYAFHPSMGDSVRNLYNQQNLALISNVGTLIEPITREQYLAYLAGDRSIQIPQRLFSHNSQAEIWQTNRALNTGATPPGWGGRLSDLLDSANSSANLSPSLSLSGTSLWQSGNNTQPFGVGRSGVRNFDYLRNGGAHVNRAASWNRLLNLSLNNPLEQQVASSFTSVQNKISDLQGALLNAPDIQTVYPENNVLATSLKMIANLISVRESLGLKRQIFFVKISGWDTHDVQLGKHAALLSQVNDALSAFYQTTEELNVANSVTSFTISEFGRKSLSNGDGTDHGWGGHQLVMGGAVNGGQVVGSLPNITPAGPDDRGSDGRIIPTIAVDQYGATLAKWMGLTNGDINTLFPNLNKFNTRDLGFLS